MHKKHHVTHSLLVIFAVCLLFTSCARYTVATATRSTNLKTYTGPLLPKTEVGYLTCPIRDIAISAIDGITIERYKKRTGHDVNFSYIELLPREHTIKVKGTSYGSTTKGFHTNLTVDYSSLTVSMHGEADLTFISEAGHVYVIRSKIIRSKDKNEGRSRRPIFSLFVYDDTTKHVVCRVERDIKK